MKSRRRLSRASAIFLLLAFTALAACEREAPPKSPGSAAVEETPTAAPTRPEKADPADWCAGHGLPESMCTKCNPELVDVFKEAGDWCAGHGLPESVCPDCHPLAPPEGAAKGGGHEGHGHEEGGHEGHGHEEGGHAEGAEAHGEWCAGHGLPESMCAKCHPELEAKFKAKGDWCAEHGFPESGCPVCNPMEPPSGEKKKPGTQSGTIIRLRHDDHEKDVGIEVVRARKSDVGLAVRAPAQIEFNENSMADIRAPVPGIVQKVLVDLGDKVEKGTPLFILESARVGELQAGIRAAKEDLDSSSSNLERQKSLLEQGIASARQVEVARREAEAAESKLDSLHSALRLAGAGKERSTGQFTIRSPLPGTVIRRPAVVGAWAGEQGSLATVADTEVMWAFVEVRGREAFDIAIGQPVAVHVTGRDDATYEGEVTWISPEVDPRTRTVRVRAEVKNPDGRLRAHQFAEAEIGIAPGESVLVVPRDAVQTVGDDRMVFVKTGPGVFEPRDVEVGRADGARYQIRGKLKPGDPVVTTGAFLLKTELAREDIGAGCCEVPED